MKRRTAKEQDHIDFLFRLEYGTEFNNLFTETNEQDELCEALHAHSVDLNNNYILPRENQIDKSGWSIIDHFDVSNNVKVSTGWTYKSDKETDTNIDNIHFQYWGHPEKPADIVWIVSYITLKEEHKCENDQETFYGINFFLYSRAEADRYIKFLKRLFTRGWTTEQIRNEVL